MKRRSPPKAMGAEGSEEGGYRRARDWPREVEIGTGGALDSNEETGAVACATAAARACIMCVCAFVARLSAGCKSACSTDKSGAARADMSSTLIFAAVAGG